MWLWTGLRRLNVVKIGLNLHTTSLPMPISTARSASPLEEPRPVKRARPDVEAGGTDGEAPDSRTETEMVEEQMKLPLEFTKTYSKELDYRKKLVLAPMVRTGTCESSVTGHWTELIVVVPTVRCTSVPVTLTRSACCLSTMAPDLCGRPRSWTGPSLGLSVSLIVSVNRGLVDIQPKPVSSSITKARGQSSRHTLWRNHIVSCCEDFAEAVIFQIGSSDPELAVKAAQTVQQDVSGM
jgi:tRNA-dihydrouridine synthase 2